MDSKSLINAAAASAFAEIDKAVADAEAAKAKAEQDLGVVNKALTDERAKSTASSATILELRTNVAALEAERALLQKQIDQLKGGKISILLGACPMKPGGTSLAAQQTVTGKWGAGAAIRQFLGGISNVAPRDPKAGIVHVSWKEYTKANLTAAKVKAALVNLKAGDVVEDGHESDNDGLTGAALQARIDIKNLFHDLVKQVRPDLLVAHTFTGWLFEPKSGKIAEAEMWLSKVKADIIGLDCDGIRPTKLPYTDYKAEFAAALPLLEKYKGMGYKWISIPEFGCPRIDAQDPKGEIRAAYHDEHVTMWEASGKVLYVTLYEYDSSPNYSLTTPAEIAGWKKHIAA